MIKHVEVNNTILEYVREHSLRENSLLQELRVETHELPEKNMQIMPEQGQFLAMLAKLTGAKRILEIGVFTGYGSASMAAALPQNGKLVGLDMSEEWVSIGRKYWEKLGLSEKIDIRIGDAISSLTSILNDTDYQPFDMVFIDADKENYDHYYEWAIANVPAGGLIVLDNTLWSGYVADPSVNDEETKAIRILNKKIHKDQRVDINMLPIADGLTLCIKK